jgi:hypothetical protein
MKRSPRRLTAVKSTRSVSSSKKSIVPKGKVYFLAAPSTSRVAKICEAVTSASGALRLDPDRPRLPNQEEETVREGRSRQPQTRRNLVLPPRRGVAGVREVLRLFERTRVERPKSRLRPKTELSED